MRGLGREDILAAWLSCMSTLLSRDDTHKKKPCQVSRGSCVTMMQASYLRDADHVTIIWWFDFARDR